MRAMRALVLHLCGVGECVRLIWGWSDHGQESGDLHGGDLRFWPRVFTVLIYPALFDQMLRAATVVLNKFCPKETLPIIFALSPLGCMYLESRWRPRPFGLKVPHLRTQSNPLPKKRVIIAIGMQGRNWTNSILFWLRLLFHNLSWPISYPHMRLITKL